jgi:hypothetical protein
MHRSQGRTRVAVLSFDHLVGPGKEVRRYIEAERLRGLELLAGMDKGRLMRSFPLARFTTPVALALALAMGYIPNNTPSCGSDPMCEQTHNPWGSPGLRGVVI